MEEKQNEHDLELITCWKAVIDSTIDGILIVNEEGIIESINPAGVQLFGYEPLEVLGGHISLLIPSHDGQEIDFDLDSYAQTGHTNGLEWGREVQGKKKGGSLFPCRLVGSEVQLKERKLFIKTIQDLGVIKTSERQFRNRNEELEQTLKIRTQELQSTIAELKSTYQQLAVEISARQQTEVALKKALKKEKDLVALKSRFISTASHEFRTPLSSILSSAELMAEYEEEMQRKQRQKHIERIKSSVKILVEILNDFFSLSKLEEGRIASRSSFFPLKDFYEEILREMESLLKSGQGIYFEGQLETAVFLDRKLLKNILSHLLSNAIIYSDPGQAIRCINRLNNQALIIDIVDNGIGIPQDDQKYLFTRFFRARNVENRQGSGLGLNMAKEYLHLMDGTISFESQLGVGTSFSINIPLKNSFQ